MPWIKIPAATATFQGEAKLHDQHEFPRAAIALLFKGLELPPDVVRRSRIIRVVPQGQFVTYGVGVKLMAMRDAASAASRAPV